METDGQQQERNVRRRMALSPPEPYCTCCNNLYSSWEQLREHEKHPKHRIKWAAWLASLPPPGIDGNALPGTDADVLPGTAADEALPAAAELSPVTS
jgi:hypothetical protein